MAALRCPHCQASLVEPVVFCGTCGRRVEGWEGDVHGGGMLVDGAAVTRRAEVDSQLRRAIEQSKSKEKQAESGAAGDDPAKTQPMPSTVRETAPTIEVPAKPQMVKRIAIVVAAGIVAFAGVVAGYRLLRKPTVAEAGKAVAEAAAPGAEKVTVNLDEPVAQPAALKRKRGKRTTTATSPSPSPSTSTTTSPSSSTQPPATQPPTGTATPPPTGTGTGTAAGTGTGTGTGTGAVVPPPTGNPLPDDLPDEEAPPTEQDLAERAKAAAYADNVRFVLKAHRAQVLACYERAFKEDGTSPGGRVTIDFTIGKDGRAHQVQTTGNSTGKELLSRCLETRLTEWEFPKPAEEFATSFPFVFSAGG